MYFVTVCTHLKRCLFGDITGGIMALNESGWIVESCLLAVPQQFPALRIDTHVVMPNHVHAVFVFTQLRPDASSPTLGSVVRHWKAMSCRLVRASTDPSFGWQRNYYERIVRNGDELERIRHYIAENPARWGQDKENPQSGANSPSMSGAP